MSDIQKERYAKAQEAIKGLTVIELGRVMIENDALVTKLASDKAEAEVAKEAIRQKLAEVMEAEGMKSFSVDSKRIRMEEALTVSAPAEDGTAERVVELLKDNGQGGMVKETVAPSTLKAFIKSLRTKGEDGLPDPLLVTLINAGVKVRATMMARFY